MHVFNVIFALSSSETFVSFILRRVINQLNYDKLF